MGELLPCPLCGGTDLWESSAETRSCIDCNKCGCGVSLRGENTDGAINRKAVAAWNTRAAQASEQEPVMWALDIDGTGSLHPCARTDPGAIALYDRPQSAQSVRQAAMAEAARICRKEAEGYGEIGSYQKSTAALMCEQAIERAAGLPAGVAVVPVQLDVIKWLLGEKAHPDTGQWFARPEGKGAFWWRRELRKAMVGSAK